MKVPPGWACGSDAVQLVGVHDRKTVRLLRHVGDRENNEHIVVEQQRPSMPVWIVGGFDKAAETKIRPPEFFLEGTHARAAIAAGVLTPSFSISERTSRCAHYQIWMTVLRG